MTKHLITLAIAVLLICVGLSGCNTQTNTDTNFEIGETAKFKQLEVTVISAKKIDFFNYEALDDIRYPDNGKIFIEIDVEVKYVGTDSEYIWAGDFWIVDSEGYKFDYRYQLIGSMELYKNQRVNGTIIFEVPENVNGLKIQFNFGTYYDPFLVDWNLYNISSNN